MIDISHIIGYFAKMPNYKDFKSKTMYESRAKIIKAMAHPSRLLIIDELYNDEKSVNELTEMIGADVSTVSKHLTVLKNAGLLNFRKEGTSIYYSLKCKCINEFLGCIETVIKENACDQIEILASLKN